MAAFFFILAAFFLGWQVGLAIGAHQIAAAMARQGIRGTVNMGMYPFWAALVCLIACIIIYI